MPFVDIRLAGAATRDQKAGIVADVTASLVARLGKAPGAVQVNIIELSTENYGSGGILIADRPAAVPNAEVASADGQR